MSDPKKSSGRVSGLFRKLSNRSKKEDKAPNLQTSGNASKGAATLSPYTAYEPKGEASAEPITEDKLCLLKEYDIKFLIDDSGSMFLDSPSRWKQVEKTLADLAPICTRYDANGIDIYFLNSEESFEEVKDPKTVMKIFKAVRPDGMTPTGARLKDILESYIRVCEKYPEEPEKTPKPLNVIVITDGVASDQGYVEDYLSSIGKRLGAIEALPKQLGVQFCQVGDDMAAEAPLKRLDDELWKEKNHRDFIDTVPYTKRAIGGSFDEELVLKTLLGSIVRRHDRARIDRKK